MTSKFSIDNRELLQRISSGEAVVGIDFGNLIIRELAAFRLAAMDSESGCLPLDYLQGHKDGLEWAARLAEANHPETGDWLYDDPIELAKAIRKGPDMPPVQPVADSEPDRNPVLAYADSYRDMAKQGVDSVPIWSVITDLERNIAPLYRHAQPAPVAYSDFESFWSSYIHPLAQDDELKGFAWDIWCAAMLQAGKSSAHVVDRPVAWHHTAKSKEENHSNCCFSYSPSHDFGPRYEKPQSQPHYLPERLDYDRALHFLSTEPRKVTPETVIGGSSPVIPDGWTGNDKANAALMMLDRIETVDPVDDDRIDGIKRIVRDLAAAPHDTPALNSVQSVVTVPGKWIPVSEQNPDCWCLTCRPVTLNDMRFVVCPDCGNKRCPRANDHRNACTRSNEPGQEGSAYPAAPQEVRGE
ncbi:hypothetical protein [Klebsiella pneumoniae]|uniref:hypothetical protein n=1 Tax=Klebsiella pneumoniae TaxID=573 RepID=UPI0035615094